MSSAPARTPPTLGRAIRGLAWTAVMLVLAASGAGLVGLAWHAPGSPSRAELTWAGDAALGARLEAAGRQLARLADDVEQLAKEAKTALEEVASSDPTRLRDALARGSQAASSIDLATRELRSSLASLPGGGPNAVLEYSNTTLVRRAAVLAAVDAASTLAGQWQLVSARATETTGLISLISQHDRIVLEAAAAGRDRRFRQAATILDEAIQTVVAVQEQRVRLIAGSEQTILDEWITRNSEYDLALQNLYAALADSRGEITLEVQDKRREEQAAFSRLPPDARTILVIVSEVARGGLTQAVVAIEDAHGHIDEAIAEAG